ncbi:MAG: hypothetical protein V3S29_08910, partial [bacterium]
MDYLIKAGVKARLDFALATALQFFDRAKEIIAEHAPPCEDKKLFELSLHRGSILLDLAQISLA